MKRLENMAFDWADANCHCEDDNIECEASALARGFEAGFRAAREMAAAEWDGVVANERACWPQNPQLIDIAVRNAERLRAMGDEEEPTT